MTTEDLIRERKKQIKIVMKLWSDYNGAYRNMLSDYWDLLEKKKNRKLKLFKLKKEILDSFPDIPFLMKDEIEAIEYLQGRSLLQIDELIAEINGAVDGAIWRIISEWNKEAKLQLRRYGLKRAYFDFSKPTRMESNLINPQLKKI